MSVFGERMKYLREKKGIKQSQLSNDLHITQTAVSNYEKGIRFPSEEMLIAIADYFHVSVDFLLGRDAFITNGRVNWDHMNPYEEALRHFTTAFINRQREECLEILTGLKAKGARTAEIYAYLIQPTLYVVGSMWETGQITIAEEHFLTEDMLSLMQERSKQQVMVKSRPYAVVLVAVHGEEHNIGIRMIGHVLKEEGFGVHYLGGNVPTEDLIQYLTKYTMDVLALSATLPSHISIAMDMIKVVREKCPSIKIIVGGQAFNANDTKALGADAVAKSTLDIVQVVESVL